MYDNQLVPPVGEVVNATRQQELFAQSRGFRNYAEMAAWAQQQQGAREAAAQGLNGPTPQGSTLPRSFGEAWDQLKVLHPKSMLEYVTRAMGGG